MPRLILLLVLTKAPIFAEGHMKAASRGLELLMVGLVVAVHQHQLLGEPDLLLGPLLRLLLLAPIQYGGGALLYGALRFLGRGADDLEHLLRLSLRVLLIWFLILIIYRSGLILQDVMGEIYDRLPERAVAASTGATGVEVDAAPLRPTMIGPAGILKILLPEVLHHQVG